MYDIFSLPDFKFPDGFLWGSSTAGHQIEGNNRNSDHWHNEYSDSPKDQWFEPSGIACDSYNRYEEDIDLVQQLGHQAFRLSIEWSRIEPEEGVYCKEAVDRYLRLLAYTKAKGIKIFLTLVHFTVPQWFAKKGGFRERKNLVYFERYLEFIVPKISQYVDFWNVLNEFNLGNSPESFTFKYNSYFFHARGYHIIKKYSNKPVSSAHALVQFYGKRQEDKFDTVMQQYYDITNNEFFFHAVRTGELVLPGMDGVVIKELKDTCDFWAINLYTRTMVDSRDMNNGDRARYRHSKLEMIPMPFYLDEFFPECMYHNTTRLMDKPIYITENGCSCNDDRFRIVWIAAYLSAMQEAIASGADIKGYLYWSLMDNYEWSSYIPRFGIVDVDRSTMERTPKPSAWFFKEIIENNGFSQEILRKYLKELPTL